MPTLTINGQPVEVPAGTRLIEAARRIGVEIPHFCYHPALTTPANCRMCLVQQKGQRRLIPACSTAVADGMEIDTEAEEARANRKGVMEFLLINHPLDCPTCDEAGECRLQDYTRAYRVADSRFAERKVTKTITDLSDTVQFWGNRCIVCTRCVRFCQEVTGTGELAVFQRGDHNEIGVFPGKTLDNPLSMNVVDICPVGALLAKDYIHKTRFWFLKTTDSTCASCAKGCSIHVDVYRGEIMRLRPRENPAVNGYWMCDRGRLNHPYTRDPRRLKRPLLARGGGHVEVSWEEAIAAVREGLSAARARHGDGAVAGWGSAWATHEEAALLKAIAEGLGGGVADFLALPDGEAVSLPKFSIPADRNPNRRGAQAALSPRAPAREGIRAVHALAGIPDLTLAPRERDFFASLDFLSVQAILPSELTRIAHVVLPAASPFERNGTFTNAQGLAQPIAAALPPPGQARPDEAILRELAAALGIAVPEALPPRGAAANAAHGA